MNVKYGIQETKDAAVFGALLGNAIDATMADGEITLTDARFVFGLMSAVKPALEGAKFIGRELADLDAAERQELAVAVAEALKLTHASGEALAEKCFDFFMQGIVIANEIRTLRDTESVA